MLDWLDVEYVKYLIEQENLTHDELSERLKSDYPNQEGLSSRNLRRFCSIHDIHKHCPLPTETLENEVKEAVSEVGGTYGRKMMQGYLEHKLNTKVSEIRVGNALRTVHPFYHDNRRKGIQNQLNPSSYHAPYFGYNLHIDQNEKLEMFGIVYVAAIDGKSAFVTSCAVMPRKNNVTIYRDVMKKTIQTHGLFEQIIVDGGKEFVLTLFMQGYYASYRASNRAPYKRVTSTKNNRIERWWGELNKRVNFPIKYCLIDLEREGREFCVDSSLPHHQFSICRVVMPIAIQGSVIVVNAWNTHNIPGSGKPKDSIIGSRATRLDDNLIVSEQAAVSMYEENNGTLTREHDYGCDLLATHPDYARKRDEEFDKIILPKIGTYSQIFGAVANHEYSLLQSAIIQHIKLSERFYHALSA